jgi:hypothetical protein
MIYVRDFNEKRENVANAGAAQCSMLLLLVVLTCINKSIPLACSIYMYCHTSIYTRDNIERLARILYRRKIRLIEGNVKCRNLKILTCKGTLRQVFNCLRPPPPQVVVWGDLAILEVLTLVIYRV